MCWWFLIWSEFVCNTYIVANIVAKTFESLVLRWVDAIITDKIDPKQFGCMRGTGTTDALIELMHKWFQATDKSETCIRILLLDYTKGFDLINHNILLEKLLKWIYLFTLLDEWLHFY